MQNITSPKREVFLCPCYRLSKTIHNPSETLHERYSDRIEKANNDVKEDYEN